LNPVLSSSIKLADVILVSSFEAISAVCNTSVVLVVASTCWAVARFLVFLTVLDVPHL
jgi:hypothetical protein